MPPEASAGVPKGTYRKYVPEGIQVPLRARASDFEQCGEIASVSYKRKTAEPFFNFRLNQSDFEQCGTCNERVSAKFPAPLATSAEREVPRATCNERGARSSPRDLQRARSAKFPAQKSRASPIKEKRCRRFSTSDLSEANPSSAEKSRASPITQRAVNVVLCVLIRNCSRLSYLLLHPKG